MSKAIVVGFNGSAGSDAALTWALARAARDKLPVIVVHAVDDRWMSPDFQYHEIIRESGMELLQQARESASGRAPDVEVDIQLRHGSGGSVLRDVSKEAAIVVVGGHDKRWLDGGSMTDRALQVVSASECPVAVIPAKQGTGERGVVVGVDGSAESLQAVAFAAAEADLGGDELTVVLAFKSPARWVEKKLPSSGLAESMVEEDRIVLAESVAGLGEKYPDLIIQQRLETDTEPANALVNIAAGARLLVIGSRGRGAFSRTVLGSTAHAVLLQVPCPTIVTRVHRVKHGD
ncbi:universal stress protein [Arthrobacter sp. ES3-54]|uniref:universal stress protein n=1 Tax=Arthrobacter sp. ES3-54 TaxID=1502991 RepID=UPI002404915A|nr:universal stress protein [Arthrobacter sp. ES3-54]MDF9749290.1 nucleotide-binding universal stress UspA family protein [Arthrobacter sp. ES3-54]